MLNFKRRVSCKRQTDTEGALNPSHPPPTHICWSLPPFLTTGHWNIQHSYCIIFRCISLPSVWTIRGWTDLPMLIAITMWNIVNTQDLKNPQDPTIPWSDSGVPFLPLGLNSAAWFKLTILNHNLKGASFHPLIPGTSSHEVRVTLFLTVLMGENFSQG